MDFRLTEQIVCKNFEGLLKFCFNCVNRSDQVLFSFSLIIVFFFLSCILHMFLSPRGYWFSGIWGAVSVLAFSFARTFG